MRKNLKQAVQRYYANHQLDNTQLEQLESILSQQTLPKKQTSWFMHHRRSLVAGLLLVFMVVGAGFFFSPFKLSHEQRIMEIAREVAKEHVHHKPLEVASHDFRVVQRYFDKLDFLPSKSRYFGSDSTLLGGRYCSIRSVTAAQIRYQSANTPAILYQAAYNPGDFGDIPSLADNGEPLTRYVNGIEVKLWVEKGLLMVTTQSH